MDYSHGGNIKKASKEFGVNEDRIIDFSANINFLGPPPTVIHKLKKQLKEIVHYPQAQAGDFRRDLARQLGIDQSKLIIGNGATEIIYLLLDFLAPRKILLPVPSFAEYEKAGRRVGAQFDYIYLSEDDEFVLPLNELFEAMDSCDLLILCSPHNPSGRFYCRDKIRAILKEATRTETTVLLDEAFIDYVRREMSYNFEQNLSDYPQLFILRSLTKFYALPGLRLGYGIGSPDLIQALEKRRDPWTVNTLAQLAGKKAITEKEYQSLTLRETKRERDFLLKSLSQLSCITTFPSSANFIFCRLDNSLTAPLLREKLGNKGILIRDCSNYRALNNKYFRLAVKSRKKNIKLIQALKRVIIKK